MSLGGDYSKFNRMLTPQGGWGIPQGLLGNLYQTMQNQQQFGTQAASQADIFGLNRRGMGRSVAGAFSYGNRRQQGERSLLDVFRGLNVDNARLRQQGQMGAAGIAAQLAQANQGPGLGAVLGSILGQGVSAGAYGLAGSPAFAKLLGLG